jgi:phage portal protein BeeE
MNQQTKGEKMTTQRAVRQQQGAWRWQIPYRVQTYVARAGSDGYLRWYLDRVGNKVTAKRLPDDIEFGGIHGRLVMTDAQRDAVYSDDNH